MDFRKRPKKEKYPMDKRIISILKKAHKRGICMKDLAEKLNISRPLLNYYLFGIKKKEVIVGGKFKNKIIIRKEGNNKFIILETQKEENVSV